MEDQGGSAGHRVEHAKWRRISLLEERSLLEEGDEDDSEDEWKDS
jgi:hypothetical protein